MIWLGIGLAVLMGLVAWMVGVTMQVARLQHEHVEQSAAERAALQALFRRLFNDAKRAGDLGAARAIQMQALSMGIDVEVQP